MRSWMKASLAVAVGQDHLWPTWHWKEPARQSYDRMKEFLDRQLKGDK